MNYFENCYTAEESKARYRQWAMKLHPDKGGDPADFREMQDQYSRICQSISIQPLLPDLFNRKGNYSYFGKTVVYLKRDNYWYHFDKPGGAYIKVDYNHLYLIKSVYQGLG